MRLIKKIGEGEAISASIIGYKYFSYSDAKSFRLSLYLKVFTIKIEFALPKERKYL